MYSFKKNDNLYHWISCIEEKRLYFGPYPNQTMINELLNENFDIIVNLTMEDENVYSESENIEENIYKIPKNKYISYPIKDNNIPECPISYCSVITKLNDLYHKYKKIYIHCRGGHGRSGMVSASLLLTINPEKTIKDIIEDVNIAHINRIILRDKWKYKKTPFNYIQYSFLLKIHKNIYINNDCKYYNWLIFNEKIIYNNKNFYNIYDLFVDKDINLEDKIEFLKEYFLKQIKSNKDIEYKLQLTYLRRIVLTDCDDKDFCNIYSFMIDSIRNTYF